MKKTDPRPFVVIIGAQHCIVNSEDPTVRRRAHHVLCHIVMKLKKMIDLGGVELYLEPSTQKLFDEVDGALQLEQASKGEAA